ncbi:hypothetical protein [Streptomyces sp. DH12]|uniref:hypothetical protein n=1 Tax=Streptomyces sp. DH12 TaxID=2857010 RepID=UPI001E47B752|nr:hypothetical protein [Streptomyces sp. DH12]
MAKRPMSDEARFIIMRCVYQCLACWVACAASVVWMFKEQTPLALSLYVAAWVFSIIAYATTLKPQAK